MAIRWVLIDEDGIEFDIDDTIYRGFKRVEDDFVVEVDKVERSSQPGADFPGIQRDASKELSFKYELYKNNDAEFRTLFNNLTQALRKCVTVKDTVLSRQTDVRYAGQTIAYVEGGHLRGASIDISIEQLLPFWESTNVFTESDTLVDGGTIVVTNSGYVETPPTLILAANSGSITKYFIRIDETGDGVIINDQQFGLTGLTGYVIDNKNGTFELEGIDRKAKVVAPTGPFKIQVGTNTMQFQFTGTMDVTIQHRERFYI